MLSYHVSYTVKALLILEKTYGKDGLIKLLRFKVQEPESDVTFDIEKAENNLLNQINMNDFRNARRERNDFRNTIWSTWRERNARRFTSKHSSMSALFHGIIAEVKLSYKLSIVKGASEMSDYKISRLFGIPFQARRVVQV